MRPFNRSGASNVPAHANRGQDVPVGATADWYGRAATELAATSELQGEWARGVAADPELLALIDGLPREHRQPSLLFAVAAWCGAPPLGYPEWRDFVVAQWAVIGPAAASRRTQTNEVGRCIPLLVGLSTFAGPLALIELGASAGLCLAVDRYAYSFDFAPVLGEGGHPLLATETVGTGRAPSRMPEIVWRAGVDLAPLDVRDADDVRWLEALLPPDRPARLARLRAAIATALDGSTTGGPPRVVAGDALASLPGLAAAARAAAPTATLVVASLGTAVYLSPADRAALPDVVAALGAHLLAFESTSALPGIPERVARRHSVRATPFVLSVDGEPLAHASAHGDRLSWLSDACPARQPELPDSAT
jgi:hypothetical protein